MDPRVTEFHCIMPLANITSVLAHGILSHERAARLTHASVAMDAIQEKRDEKAVPGGLRLHQYANLYFHARNPMLYKRKDRAGEMCVLRVSTDILNHPGVVFADCNASSDYVRFLDPHRQWRLLAYDDIYALDWRHADDQIAYFRHRSRKCAEVLVPYSVSPQYVVGAYVVDSPTANRLRAIGFPHPISIEPGFFFR